MTKTCCVIVALTVGLASNGTALAQTSAETRLKELNVTLPSPTRLSPSGNRTGAVQIGNMLYLAGHPSQFAVKGKVGKELTVEQGHKLPESGRSMFDGMGAAAAMRERRDVELA